MVRRAKGAPIAPKLSVFLSVAVAATLAHGFAAAGPIAVLKSKSIPAYEEALAGVREAVAIELQVFDLEGRLENGPEVARRMRALDPSVVVTIGARAAQVAKAFPLGVPVVYCLVLHPARFGLDAPGFVGVPLWVPASQQLLALRRILPRMRRVGLVGNPAKNRSHLRDIRRAARAARVKVSVTQIQSPKDVPAALEQLLERVDALWLLPDSTVLNDESFRYLLLQAFRRRIPVLAFARSFVQAGALLALSPDYRAMGRTASTAATRILRGESKLKNLVPPARLIVNTTTASRLGLRLPAELARGAELVE